MSPEDEIEYVENTKLAIIITIVAVAIVCAALLVIFVDPQLIA